MNAVDWQNYLAKAWQDHRKNLYSITELQTIAQASRNVISVELARLCQRGILQRYAHGVYGLPNGVQPEDLLPYLDNRAYITGHAALLKYGYITQVTHVIDCFTTRRARKRKFDTPAGHFLFHTVKRPVFLYPAEGHVAPPEQALLDYVYLLRLQGVEAQGLVTFRKLHELDPEKLEQLADNYPQKTWQEALSLLPDQMRLAIASR